MRKYRIIIERITIIGKMEERDKAFDYIWNNRFRIRRFGPKKISKTKYDTKKFKIIAEREVKNGKSTFCKESKKG